MHTQSLRMDIERVKRQKLGFALKKVKRDLIPQDRVTTQLRHDFHVLRSHFDKMQQTYDNKISRISTVTY